MDFNAGLERYLLMAKVQKGAACRELIDQAIGAPDVFMFQELLDLPTIQALEGTEHEPSFRLLQCFAYGTINEYKAQSSCLPELKPAQHRKLQLLTLVSACSQSKLVPYDHLLLQTGIATVDELEDLMIDSFGLGLIQGQLDQENQQVQVSFAASRDLQEGDLDKMLSVITGWATIAQDTLSHLRQEMQKADKAKADVQDEQLALKLKVEALTQEYKATKGKSQSGRAPRVRAVRDTQTWGQDMAGGIE